MRILIESDWHLEYHEDGGLDLLDRVCTFGDRADVLALAGDISHIADLASVFDRVCQAFNDVVYVPGNHEFWGCTTNIAWDTLKSYERPCLHILRNECVDIRGVPFFGGTMWFPEGEPWYYGDLHECMPDFAQIKEFVPWVHDEHRDFLRQFGKCVDDNTIVITHHLPSIRSTPVQFIKSELNRFFVVNMEEQILAHCPRAWIHGHTHEATSYHLGNTRVICNPFGVFESDYNGYKAGQILEL